MSDLKGATNVVEAVAVNTVASAPMVMSQVAGLVATGMIISCSGIRWSSPMGAVEDLKNEVMKSGNEIPVTATFAVLMGLGVGARAQYNSLPFAGYNGFIAGISTVAGTLYLVDMIMHYTTIKPRTSEQMWNHVSSGALVGGVTGGTSAMLGSVLG
jgi:hypothetical protein